MSRPTVRALTMAASLALAVACASDPAPEPVPADPSRRSAADEIGKPPAPAALRIYATGDTKGFIGPCGCDDAQYGGIARRGTYLRDVARDGDLRIDVGNAAAGSGGLRDLRLRTTLEALEALDYDVYVPTAADLRSGEVLGTWRAQRRKPAIVSANVVDESGALPFANAFSQPMADGRTALVVGVTGAAAELPDGWRVTPPGDAIRRAMAQSADADAVVLAAAMPAGEAEALAARMGGGTVVISGGPEVDRMAAMSMTGHETKDADEGFRGADPPVAVAGDFGSYVRRVDLGDDLQPRATWRAWLGEDVTDDPELAALNKRFRKAVATLDPDLIPDILKGLDARGFAGSAACAECHDGDHTAWAESLHAKGMPTLVEKESSRDPDCVPCHLVDVKEGAATDLSVADTLGIGCEACHAGRAKHIELARAGRLDEEPPPPFTAREVCTGCHHPPEVKSFDFDVLWPRIEHGE